jgi:DNA-binding FrmR family transcriptional regulator
MTKSDPNLIARLARIEGQVRGVARMLEEDRYCIDVLDQLQAVKAALKKVEEQILKNHVDHCVAKAVEAGDIADQRKKFAELADLLARYAR